MFMVSLNDLLIDEIGSSKLKVNIGLRRLIGLEQPRIKLTSLSCKKARVKHKISKCKKEKK
jgi:hypothetical protein